MGWTGFILALEDGAMEAHATPRRVPCRACLDDGAAIAALGRRDAPSIVPWNPPPSQSVTSPSGAVPHAPRDALADAIENHAHEDVAAVERAGYAGVAV